MGMSKPMAPVAPEILSATSKWVANFAQGWKALDIPKALRPGTEVLFPKVPAELLRRTERLDLQGNRGGVMRCSVGAMKVRELKATRTKAGSSHQPVEPIRGLTEPGPDELLVPPAVAGCHPKQRYCLSMSPKGGVVELPEDWINSGSQVVIHTGPAQGQPCGS